MDNFEPKIVGFLCNWCTYAGADTAGTLRIQYPPNIRPIRVMCSGSVDPAYVLWALLRGADGVFIGGCRPGDCHYVNGNYKMRRRVTVLRSILKTLGLGDNRIWVKWVSTSEGKIYANTMSKMIAYIKELGPNPINKYWSI